MGVKQNMIVYHTANKAQKVESLKLRWRMTYTLAGEAKADTGDVAEFFLA